MQLLKLLAVVKADGKLVGGTVLVTSLSDLGFSEEGAIIKSIESDDCGRGQKQWKAEAIHHYFLNSKLSSFYVSGYAACIYVCVPHV